MIKPLGSIPSFLLLAINCTLTESKRNLKMKIYFSIKLWTDSFANKNLIFFLERIQNEKNGELEMHGTDVESVILLTRKNKI